MVSYLSNLRKSIKLSQSPGSSVKYINKYIINKKTNLLLIYYGISMKIYPSNE